jgi:hypothetical protein
MDLNKSWEQDRPGTGLAWQLIFDFFFNDAEPVAVTQHFLAEALSVGPLTVRAVAMHGELVFQIFLGYQQRGCDRNIIGAECSLRKFNMEPSVPGCCAGPSSCRWRGKLKVS